MNFSTSITINQSRDKVVDLFKNPDDLIHWQDGFQGIECISGTPGEEGARKKMFYKSGKHDLELIETIQLQNYPEEFKALYEARQMVNTMRSRFVEVGLMETRFETEINYTSFHGLVPKLMALLFPGVFEKQGEKWFKQFKEYAEKQN